MLGTAAERYRKQADAIASRVEQVKKDADAYAEKHCKRLRDLAATFEGQGR